MREIMIFLIFIISKATTKEYINTPIDSPSGLYFEGLSNIRIIKGHWTFLTSINLEMISRYIELLMVTTSNYEELCQDVFIECRPHFLKLQKWDLADQDLRIRWNEIKDFVRPIIMPAETALDVYDFKTSQRERTFIRSAFFNSPQQTHTNDRVRTTYIPNGLKGIMTKIDDKKIQIKDLINEVNAIKEDAKAHSVDIVSNMTEEQATRIFATITELTDNVVDLRFQLLNSFMEVMTNAKIGLLHLHTFELDELRSSIKKFSEDENMALPLLQDQAGLAEIQDIAKIKILTMDGSIMIVLTIPLIDKTNSYLYKMHPHPVLQQIGQQTQIFGQVNSFSSYIIIHNSTQHYAYPPSNYLLESCKPNSQYFICNPSLVFYPINFEAHCEISLLYGLIPHRCDIRILGRKKNQWIPLNRPGEWLYSLIHPATGQLTCQHQDSMQIHLSQYGKLSIPNDCQFNMSNLLLKAPNTTYDTSTIPDIVPKKPLNLSQLFPGIDSYEQILKFDGNYELPNEIPLNYILHTIAQKVYKNHRYPESPQPVWPWKTLTIMLVFLISFIILTQFLTEWCISRNCRRPEVDSPIPEELIVLSSETSTPNQNEPSTSLQPNEPHYQIPRRPVPINSPKLKFKGPLPPVPEVAKTYGPEEGTLI